MQEQVKEVVEAAGKSLKEEIFARLDILAEKLGTTVEYLWEVLVTQSYVHGAKSLVWALLFVGMAGIGYYFTKRTHENKDKFFLDNEAKVAFTVVLTVATIAAVLGAAGFLGDALGYFINPEYYALREVINHVR